MKKLILMFTIALLLGATAVAQEKYKSYADFYLNRATYIIEGSVVERTSVIDVELKTVFVVTKIQITNIFRNGKKAINTGTILIVQKNHAKHVMEDGTLLISPPSSGQAYLKIPDNGVYFCYVSKAVSSLIEINTDNPFTLATPFTVSTDNLKGFEKTFKSKKELYLFLQNQDNISIPENLIQNESEKKNDVNSNSLKEQKTNNELKVKAANKERYAKNVQNYEKHMQWQLERINKANESTKEVNCDEFFISEYIDGPFKNKVIEIYNPTDSIKSITGYSIRIFNNGAPTPIEIHLSGDVNPKEMYVVTNPLADQEILNKANLTSNQMNFDGNDAVVLNKGQSTYIDKIGEIGVNPGVNGWHIPPNSSTVAHDLRRKFPIDKGEIDWTQGKDQWNTLPPDSLENIEIHDNICKGADAIEYLSFSFANATETGTNPTYFEFDIMAQGSSNDTYFDNCLLRISYNTGAFGSDIVANNKITVTKGATYNDISYVDPDTMIIDQTSSVIGLPFGVYFDTAGTWNRTLVTTTPTQILHIKIEIENCGQYSAIDFTDISFTPWFSFYTDNANEDATYGNTYSYDDTYYLNSLNQELCPFNIISFTSPVYPGSYYPGNPVNEALLTINGNGFGNTRGNGNVYFKNAGDGGQTYVKLNAYDFNSWSDTEIIITVPSIIDSIYFPKYPTPGGGAFYIKRNSGDSTISNTLINFPYVIRNTIRPLAPPLYEKIRIDVANVNDSGGITFRFDTSITNYPNPMLIPTIKKAVAEWVCATGINFIFGADTTLNGNNADGVSVIYMKDTLNEQTALGYTSTHPVICGNPSFTERYAYSLDIDIGILRDPTVFGSGAWQFDTLYNQILTNKNDFYEVILHELGHGNMLGHCTNFYSLMYYQAKLGPVAGIDRRYINSDDQEGGMEVVDKSALNNYDVSCNVDGALIIVDEPCTFGPGFIETNPNVINYNLYPNPISDNQLTVAYEIKESTFVVFKVIDIYGKVVFVKKENKTAGNYQEQINLNKLSRGIYFFVAEIDGITQTNKIVKVR